MTRLIQLARRRAHGHLWPILQTAVAAVGAWYLAVVLGVEQRPAFASIAAVISLGAAFGQRRQRAVQLTGGVMLGIVLADLLVRAIGSGLGQIGLLVVLAMLAAVILGGEELLVTEAAVSAILVATLSSTPQVRLLDVLIGGGVALAVNTLVFPPDPVLGVARATNAVFGELGAVLRDAAGALSTGDVRHGEAAAQAADNAESHVRELRQAVVVGADTARWAPLRRTSRGELERYARMVAHIDLATRSARELSRNVLHHVRGGRAPQPDLAEAVRDLGLAAWELPAQFKEPWRSGDVLRIALQAGGRATAAATRDPDIRLNEIAGQVRSIAIDIVRASEAVETDRGAIIEASTEELLAALPASRIGGTLIPARARDRAVAPPGARAPRTLLRSQDTLTFSGHSHVLRTLLCCSQTLVVEFSSTDAPIPGGARSLGGTGVLSFSPQQAHTRDRRARGPGGGGRGVCGHAERRVDIPPGVSQRCRQAPERHPTAAEQRAGGRVC